MTEDARPPLLEVEHLSGGYGNLQVLRDVSFRVARGGALGILGPNAAGKSTLLRGIMGLLTRSSGRVSLEGIDLTVFPAHKRALIGLSVVPEGRGLIPSLTVLEHLQMCPTPRRFGRELIEIEDIFELFPVLADRQRQRSGLMSGGEQQMLAIARALRLNPKVLLLDEPSSGLAPIIVEQVVESIVAATQRGVAVVLVEQQSELALEIVDNVLVIAAGAIVLSESVNDVSRKALHHAYLGITEQTVRRERPS